MAGYPAHLTFGHMKWAEAEGVGEEDEFIADGQRNEWNDQLRVGEISFPPWKIGKETVYAAAYIKRMFTPEEVADHLTGKAELEYLFNKRAVRLPSPPNHPRSWLTTAVIGCRTSSSIASQSPFP